MPAAKKTGKEVSKKSYEVKRPHGKPSLWRFTVTDFDKRDPATGEPKQIHGHYDSFEECEERRQEAIAELEQRKALTVAQAIRLYELFKQREGLKTYENTICRLNIVFASVMRTQIQTMNEERFRLLYSGREGIVNGAAKVLIPGLVHRTGRGGQLMRADSHRGYLAESKTFLRWCMGRGYLAQGEEWLNRVKGEGKRRRGGMGKRRLTRTELDQVYLTAYRLMEEGDKLAKLRQSMTGGRLCDLRERAVSCLFSLLLGLRSQEIRKMRVRDINTRLWIFEVEEDAAKTPDSEREAEIPERLRPHVQRLMEGKSPEMYLFGSGDKPRQKEWPLESVRRVCEEAGTRMETAHGMRGAHRDISLEHGATGPMVDAQLGHTAGSDTGAKSYQTEHGTRAQKRAKRKAAQAAFEALLRTGGSN